MTRIRKESIEKHIRAVGLPRCAAIGPKRFGARVGIIIIHTKLEFWIVRMVGKGGFWLFLAVAHVLLLLRAAARVLLGGLLGQKLKEQVNEK